MVQMSPMGDAGIANLCSDSLHRHWQRCRANDAGVALRTHLAMVAKPGSFCSTSASADQKMEAMRQRLAAKQEAATSAAGAMAAGT